MWHTWRGREIGWPGHVAHMEGKRNEMAGVCGTRGGEEK